MHIDKTKYFTRILMKWNQVSNHRMMPWKGEKDPYKVWISEVILQQTRVEQGLEYYKKFILEFPNVSSLAAAPTEKVYKRWEGLGYYSRCNNLLKAAYIIVNEFNGKFPSQYEQILSLPGIGPYTASAIASFVFGEKKAVVDGNVYRVLSRFFGIDTPVDSGKGKKEFELLAQQLVAPKNPGEYNQAIMDFGATICKPQPVCTHCPLSKECLAYAQGNVHSLPVKSKRLEKKERNFYFFILEEKGKYLVRKREQSDIWKNLHEFPSFESEHLPEPLTAARKYFNSNNLEIRSLSKPYKQILTHRLIHARFVLLGKGKFEIPEGYQWASFGQIQKMAFPRIINLFLEEEHWLH